MKYDSIIVDSSIQLKPLGKLDIEPIFECIQTEREYLGKWLPFVEQTLEMADTERFVNNFEIAESSDFIYSIYYYYKFAGIISIKDPDFVNKKAEIGYWISVKYQHKGIITKSCSELIRFAFNTLSFNRIQIKVAVENKPSQRVPERLNFTFEGIERDGEFLHNQFVDLKVYSLLRGEF